MRNQKQLIKDIQKSYISVLTNIYPAVGRLLSSKYWLRVMVKVHSYILVISHSRLVHHMKEYNPNAILVNPSTPYRTLVNPSSPYEIHIYTYIYIYTSSTRTRRGGSCLKDIYKTFLIYRTCMRRAPAKPVRACTLRNWCLVSHVTFQAPLRTSHFSLHSSHSTTHFTVHTSHFFWLLCAKLLRRCCPRTWPAHDPGAMQRQATTFFTLHTALFTLLHTCTSHLHFALDTSSLKSCELFSPHLSSSHLIPSLPTCQLSKFFSTVFISSEHWPTFLISLEFVSTHLGCSARKKTLTVREKSFAPKNIGRGKLLHTDTWDTDAFTHNRLSEILCTTKLAQNTSLPRTTLYCNACTNHFPVLLCTTKLAQSISQYYYVLQKLAETTSQYYFALQSLQKALPSTTLYYKARTKHFPVLLCTTKLAQTTSQ